MRVSPDVEIACSLAAQEARRRQHDLMTVEHLLYALLHDRRTSRILAKVGANIDRLRGRLDSLLRDEVPPASDGTSAPRPSRGFRRVLERAALHVESCGKSELLAEDLLVAIFSEVDSPAVALLDFEKVSRLDVVTYIAHGKEDNETSSAADGQQQGELEAEERNEPERNPLQQFAINLNERAKSGDLEPLVGRVEELRRVVQILARRRKNNPILVGDAGVGKTAIVEGLAQRINSGNVPELLRDATVWSLDLGALVAGTKYRGDFENRIKGVIKALEAQPSSVLFLDEMHTLMGAGSTSGTTLDAANLLKPALSSGRLRCIGATTFEDYRQHIERDRALARRFQKVEINEPSSSDALAILRGIIGKYEEFHGVTYPDVAVEAAVNLSVRHLSDRKLPDKAIDVVDEAGADVRLEVGTGGVVDVERIEAVIARIAQIPSRSVSRDDRTNLSNLEVELNRAVYGQRRAIAELSDAVKLSRAGLRAPEKPIGSFLFTGPTGVGKTEVARQLARTMGIQLLRFDMSEYMERHTVSRLVGAPPGYVGYDRGGLLTEAVAKSPHSVLLLDEIEKAHPDVFNILLQVMDHGTLTDTNGKKADFRNTILIMTSNVGAADLAKALVGFGARDRRGNDDVAFKNMFSPEFRNRLDARISFEPLSQDVMVLVVDKFIAELQAQLDEKQVTLTLSDEAREGLAQQGYHADFGARPLLRLIQDKLKRPLANELLFGALAKGGLVHVVLEGGEFGLRCEPSVKLASSSALD
ncbi:MAG TPA: ATP-dependent Clp protease ATP-binding subunit ClpA [Polyangiaceae bacterium]